MNSLHAVSAADDTEGNADLRARAAEHLNKVAEDLYDLTALLHRAVLDPVCPGVADMARRCEALADALMAGNPAPEQALHGRRIP